MITIEITDEEKARLNYERYYHLHPSVQRKMEVVWLKSNDLPHHEIARLAGVSINTVTNHLDQYQQGGIEQLKEIHFYQPTSELCNHSSTLEQHFRDQPPASVKEAMDTIQTLTGIKRSETQVRVFLHSIGMRPRKVGMLPAKADPEKQATFLEDELTPRLEEAQAGERKVFFVDAAHFVLSPFLGYLWSFARIFIKAPSGRKRYNVLGALDAISHQLITITNDKYINARSVCGLLIEIARQQYDVPVTLVMDNARYQKCKLVQALADKLDIKLLFLPPYSPNLNLIERLWKFVKKKCLYSKYYDDFTTFKQAINDCLAHTHTTYKKDLDSLLTLRFQKFEKTQGMVSTCNNN